MIVARIRVQTIAVVVAATFVVFVVKLAIVSVLLAIGVMKSVADGSLQVKMLACTKVSRVCNKVR